MAADEYARSVSEYYGNRDLSAVFREGLEADGKDLDNLSYADLSVADHYHTRGKDATWELIELAGLRAGQRVLDVGGGVGGPARMLAAEVGVYVTVLDLTEEYCRTGETLTEWTRLSDLVTFRVGSALDMPFNDESFDVAWTQHSSMNIADKERLYAEIHRVLKPGGRLSLHEIMGGEVEPIHFPVPWAPDQSISFLRPAEAIHALIARTGFREVAWVDVSERTLEWARMRAAVAASGPPPAMGLHFLLSNRLGPAMGNVARNLEEKRIVVVEAVFDKK